MSQIKKNKTKLINRRDFLKLAGVTTAGATIGNFIFSEEIEVPLKLLDKLKRKTGKETWVNSVCGNCTGGCGITIRLIDDIPIYIKGNPNFPINLGGICPMAQTSTELLFHPDRVKTPLQNTGIKGSGNFKKTTWKEANKNFNAILRNLIDKGEGNKLAIYNGDISPLGKKLSKYWLKSFGSSNYFEDPILKETNISVQLSQGINLTPAYDLENSRYIINFGNNLLEEGNSPVYYQRLFGNFRSGRRQSRATLVHIDSRINLTGAKADLWVPIKPGTYGALALGIAHILIVDRLFDNKFIEDDTFGFENFEDENGIKHLGFKEFVKKNYYPEKVSEITGIPSKTIIKLGEEFGTYRPALAIGDNNIKVNSKDSFTQWAIYSLNALIGNIQKKGGVYFSPFTPEFNFPESGPDLQKENPDSSNKPGLMTDVSPLFGDISIDDLARSIVSGEYGKIDTLIIINANPVFKSRQRNTIENALKKIKNVIYIGTMVDETAKLCDLILPDHTFIEKTDVIGPVPGTTFGHIGAQQPVVNPVFDTKQWQDVLIKSGRELFGSKKFTWKNYKDIVDQRIKIIYESGQGSIISASRDLNWEKYLKERGWKFQQFETFESFKKLLLKSGGWLNSFDPTRSKKDIFHTRSEKFEFYSSTLSNLLKKDQSKSGNNGSSSDFQLMPHFEKNKINILSEEYPLTLTVSQLLTNIDGKGASQPSLLEMVGINAGHFWKSWVEINPETAKEYNLKDRKPVLVQSSFGEIRAEARFYNGMVPDVIHIHLGLGHTSFGRYGTGIGINVTDIMGNQNDLLTNLPVLNGTPVKIRKLI